MKNYPEMVRGIVLLVYSGFVALLVAKVWTRPSYRYGQIFIDAIVIVTVGHLLIRREH